MSTPKKSDGHQEINFNALLQAIKQCMLEEKGIRATAREFGIDKSSLQRHVKKVKAVYDDISSVKDDVLLELIRTSHMKIPPNMVCLLFVFLSYFFR